MAAFPPQPLWLRMPRLILALGAGGMQALSLALPGSGGPAWWLQIGSLAVLAGLVGRARRAREAFGLGWAFAIAWLVGAWWWLFISMHVYGGLPAPLAALAVCALAAALGLYYALACLAAWRLVQGQGQGQGQEAPPSGRDTGAGALRALGTALVFAAAWLLAELARGRWFTGFPWGAGGYAHVEGPLAALAPWAGVYGIGFVAALVAGLLAAGFTPATSGPALAGQGAVPPAAGLAASRGNANGKRQGGHRRWVIGAALILVLLAAATPSPDLPASPALSVSLLQGNIPQDEKFRPGTGVRDALDWYGKAMQTSRGELVVAPETAIPLLPRELPPHYLQALDEHFRGGTQALLVGLPLGDAARGYTNSVLGLGRGADAYRYDKHHLVPFGEFIPPLFRWFTEMMEIPLGDFARGGVGQRSFAWKGQQLAPNICYEDLFGEELAARFKDPARAPTVFVNVSNIAWFGDSVAIEQHLQISRMRALEFRRPMLRATNTGATAIIDAEGRVTHRLPRLTRGVLDGEVQGRTGLTPFARWASAWGLAPLWALGVGLLAAFALADRRRGG